MNRKGFTLVELMVVILVIGLILVVAIPSLINIYKNSKLRSEKIFTERLDEIISGYVKLNSGDITFTSYGEGTKENGNSSYQVSIYKGNITIQNIIDESLISPQDFINSGNKETKCNPNAQIEVYKDSDYVYCYKLEKNQLDCLTEEYKNSITGNYVIDTCIWSK